MRVRFGLVRWAVAASLACFACGSPSTPAVVPMAAAAPEDVVRADAGPTAAAADAGADAGNHGPDPARLVEWRTCGCSLCTPVVSEDACASDADCAPSQPCHAPACVARSKAQLRKPGEMCTRVMLCNSTDANACGCVSGRCTLSPRGTP